jgi:hypothetical protein
MIWWLFLCFALVYQMGNCLDSSSAKVDSTQSSHNPGNITFAFCFSSFTVVASSSFLGFGLFFFQLRFIQLLPATAFGLPFVKQKEKNPFKLSV